MANHPLKDLDVKLSFVKKLQKLTKAWQKLAEAPLQKRQKILAALASGFYDLGYHRTHTLNLIDRGISTIVPFLVEGDPRIMVETPVANLRPWAYTTQLALNFYVQKLQLADNVLIPVALNSMIGAGITKTSLTHDRNLEVENTKYRLGTPSVAVIDDSNYIGDPAAKTRRDFIIEGDIYRLPTEYAKEFFGAKFADDIVQDGKLREDYSPDDVSASNFDKEILSIREFSTFIDLYLYDENVILTIMPEGKKARILREIEWEGPPGGPYDYLAYKFFPNSPLPIPPAWSWYDMDVTMNILIEKMRIQAEAQKDILAYQSGSEDDVKRITETPSNSTVRVDNIDLLKDMHFGGVNPLNYQWVEYIENQHTKQGGNADVVAGRGATAPTLGQEQMVMTNAMRIIYNHLSRFDRFQNSLMKKLAWGFWTDPTQYVPVVKEIPGVGELPQVFSDTGKVGDFYDFVFKVIPYSTQRTNPEMLFNKLMMFLTQWVIPSMPLAAQEGTTIDHKVISETLARYIGIDNINSWFKTIVPQPLESVNYKMMPESGQLGGASERTQSARTSNRNQQQARSAGRSSPPQKGEGERLT